MSGRAPSIRVTEIELSDVEGRIVQAGDGTGRVQKGSAFKYLRSESELVSDVFEAISVIVDHDFVEDAGIKLVEIGAGCSIPPAE